MRPTSCTGPKKSTESDKNHSGNAADLLIGRFVTAYPEMNCCVNRSMTPSDHLNISTGSNPHSGGEIHNWQNHRGRSELPWGRVGQESLILVIPKTPVFGRPRGTRPVQPVELTTQLTCDRGLE